MTSYRELLLDNLIEVHHCFVIKTIKGARMKNENERWLDQNIINAVDTVVFTIKDRKLLTLLVKRKDSAHNYAGQWSLPGGVVDVDADASTEETAIKKLEAKTGIKLKFLEQLKSYSGKDRDERGWSVSIVHFILMRHVSDLKENDDGSESKWVDVATLEQYEPFAFDHRTIIDDAIERLREKTRYSLLPAYCLEDTFTLNQFHEAVEIILGHEVPKKSLYRRIKESKALEKTSEMKDTGTKKAALYRANEKTGDHTFERNLSPPKEKLEDSDK